MLAWTPPGNSDVGCRFCPVRGLPGGPWDGGRKPADMRRLWSEGGLAAIRRAAVYPPDRSNECAFGIRPILDNGDCLSARITGACRLAEQLGITHPARGWSIHHGLCRRWPTFQRLLGVD